MRLWLGCKSPLYLVAPRYMKDHAQPLLYHIAADMQTSKALDRGDER